MEEVPVSFSAEEEADFAVWGENAPEAEAQKVRASSARSAAEHQARLAWSAGQENWPTSYRVRDGVTGDLWIVVVTVVSQPSFVATDAHVVPMPPATHVLWGGRTLCSDRRLRGVPSGWPLDQRWTSLEDVANGAVPPPDRCEACWAKAPALVDGIRRIGTPR